MFRQKLFADAWLAIKAMQGRFRGKPHQIAISLIVFCNHQQVMIFIALRVGPVIVLLADVELAAENRIDVVLLRGIKKLHRAVDIAVVRHCHGLLVHAFDVLYQLVNIACSVEQRIVGVQVQMSKFGHGLSSILVGLRRTSKLLTMHTGAQAEEISVELPERLNLAPANISLLTEYRYGLHGSSFQEAGKCRESYLSESGPTLPASKRKANNSLSLYV